ncbi:RtcB family protein [Pseudoclavibacter sp. RFBB5]|uniref:RtcB family protein n=1 Tax=Pseudoclavibacter sp. RFBB5 TaxID=2080574 RepID=UPI000CE8D5AD|nr:RtcB family protein [Pseudoclavibacter sp. RFBB5]PPG29661.1 RNA-splicing ligase RtcB [Pseudoclavibacter sp. RFBB5]
MTTFPAALSDTTNTLLWANEADIEPQAVRQLRNIAALPWVHGVRVMPDVHLGKGATVGSVIAMEQAVSPSAVGVDIGCGVAAVRTSLTESDLERLPQLRSAIEQAVPVGFSSHDEPLAGLFHGAGAAEFWAEFGWLHGDVSGLEDRAHRQLGTLGGGNHFIELCVDADSRVWITLHSGSRNIGKVLAEQHISIAKELPQNQDLPDKDLAVFLRGTPEMEAYRHDLDWAQDFARRSRAAMMHLVMLAVEQHWTKPIAFDSQINCHHNYVAEETIDGKRMLVTRKGAIRAGSGDLALIPGSMGTGSYVVKGLGNDASFQSASHGAGRRMSRNKAKKAFTVADLIEQTAGVESRKDAAIIDEIPAAYKDIAQVVEAQKDLVQVVQHLRTVLCVKG